MLLVLVLAAIVGGLWFNQHRGLKAVATETHDALCAYKADVQTRRDATRQYVADVKAGRREPVAGISDADIRRSLGAQRSTLAALESLHCD